MNAAPGIVAVIVGHPGDAGDRHLGAAVLPHHQRLLRRLAHGPARPERVRDRRRVPLRRVASSASPGWCSPSAPTCCGTRSAGPPATSCCWCWSPRRCAVPAPTRCPTSPRPGSTRGRVRRVCSLLVVADRLALPAAAVPGRRASPSPSTTGAPAGSARSIVAARRAGERDLRRDAQHHLRPGLPVLAEAHRAADPGRGAARRLGRGRRDQPGRRAAGTGGDLWSLPLGEGGGEGLYLTYSLIIATFLGTMGLPHVVVRFYTNPDGRRRAPDHARRARPARHLLPAAAGVRRPRPRLRARSWRNPGGPTPWCWSCRG